VPEAEHQCPACRRPLRSGTQFCPECGHNLVDPAVTAPPAPGRTAELTGGKRFVQLWQELKRLAWLFGLLLATSFVFGIVWRQIHSPWLDVMQTVVMAVIVLISVGKRYQRLKFLFEVRSWSLGEAAVLAGVAIVFIGLATAYFGLLGHLGVPIAPASGMFTRAGWPLWSVFLLVSVAPAVFEELAFRGVIQSSLERMLNTRDAWLIQAALFSVLHLSPLMFPSHFLMGLCFGYMRRRSRSIYPGMLLHAAWNAFVVVGELAA
jgi:membrane protease YdiL (CAAX protease family)